MTITKETYFRLFRNNGSQLRIWRESKYEGDNYVEDIEQRFYQLEAEKISDDKLAQEILLMNGVAAVQVGTEQKGIVLYKDWP